MTAVAVIIVNHGTADLAFAAAESVQAREHPGCDVSVHLVDNASGADDRARLKRRVAAAAGQSYVHLHLLDVNGGFGAGNNAVLRDLALQHSPPDYVFLLNPDATLASEAIAILARFLDAHPDAAFAGAQLRLPDSKSLRPSAQRFPTLASTLAHAADVPILYRCLWPWTAPYPRSSQPLQVDWVPAAAVLARFNALCDLQHFDPRFFLYLEEVDLMRRAADRGLQCWHVPRAEVYHAEGGSTGFSRVTQDRQRWPSHWYASWVRYLRTSHGWGYVLACAGAWALGDLINRLASPFTGRPRAVPLHFYADLWRHGIGPLLGLGAPPPDAQGSASR